MKDKKIIISKNGPYIVKGNIPLKEMIIAKDDNGYIYKEGKQYEQKNEYLLCRCGKSNNSPFCDGSHACFKFDGELTAKDELNEEDAVIYEGENLKLIDYEELCAFARFCHSKKNDVWNLTENATNKKEEDLAVKLACDCPSGRLIMVDKKSNQEIEPAFEPSIVLLQDPLKNCSGPIFVRGGIPIESDDGKLYQIRNRVTLCRCGESTNKPFCDATHIGTKFKDKHFKDIK